MSDFSLQNSIARKMLEKKGVICIHKTTRAGATNSLVKNAVEIGKKTAVVVPTIKLIDEIEQKIPMITDSKPAIASILSNTKLCLNLPKDSKMKFLFKPRCRNCEYEGSVDCRLQEILTNDHDLYVLTHHKLRALQLSVSTESKKLLQQLYNCTVFILDEFTTIILASLPTLILNRESIAEGISNLRNKISGILRHADKDKGVSASILYDTLSILLGQIESIREEGVYSNDSAIALSDKEVQQCFSECWRYAAQLSEIGFDTRLLQDLLILSACRQFVLTIHEEEYILTAKFEDALGFLRKFIKSIGEGKTVFLVDAYQPTINHDNVFKESVSHILWGSDGDPLGTNKAQLIIADTAHWGARDFERDRKLQQRIKKFLTHLISKFPAKYFLIVTTNKLMASIISRWNLPKEVKITWFRSDLMRGVPVKNKQIMVCVGGSYLKKSSYVAESQSFRFEDFFEAMDSLSDDEKTIKTAQILRLDNTRSEFTNAIGRVKDPLGHHRSLVFTLGMRMLEVLTMLKQSGPCRISSPSVIEPIRKGGFIRDSSFIAELWLSEGLKELTRRNINDLPIISRLLRIMKPRSRIRASEVIPRETKLVIEVAKRNYPILRHYNVNLRRIQGGYIFEQNQ